MSRAAAPLLALLVAACAAGTARAGYVLRVQPNGGTIMTVDLEPKPYSGSSTSTKLADCYSTNSYRNSGSQTEFSLGLCEFDDGIFISVRFGTVGSVTTAGSVTLDFTCSATACDGAGNAWFQTQNEGPEVENGVSLSSDASFAFSTGNDGSVYGPYDKGGALGQVITASGINRFNEGFSARTWTGSSWSRAPEATGLNDGNPLSTFSGTVVLDFTVDTLAPTVSSLALASSHGNGIAEAGDTITATLQTNEAVTTPSMVIAGVTAVVSGSHNSWTGVATVGAVATEGAATVSVAPLTDLAGNTAASGTTATTDGSGVRLVSASGRGRVARVKSGTGAAALTTFGTVRAHEYTSFSGTAQELFNDVHAEGTSGTFARAWGVTLARRDSSGDLYLVLIVNPKYDGDGGGTWAIACPQGCEGATVQYVNDAGEFGGQLGASADGTLEGSFNYDGGHDGLVLGPFSADGEVLLSVRPLNFCSGCDHTQSFVMGATGLSGMAGASYDVASTVYFGNERVAPAAALDAKATVTAADATSETFVVTYTDDSGLDPYTAGIGDVIVSGPGGNCVVTAAVASGNSVTYTCTPPGGTWDEADNGEYTVSVVADQVHDLAGNPAAAGAAGTFAVLIDTTKPVLSAPSAAGVSPTTAEVQITTNEDGRVYCCAWVASDDEFSASQVVSGAGSPVACHDEAASAGTPVAVTITGLTLALYDIWCAPQDTSPSVSGVARRAETLANTGDVVEIPNVLVGECKAEHASSPAPLFDVAGSEITAGDDLLLKWTSSRHYDSHQFVFRDAAGDDACSMQTPQDGVGEAIDEEEWERTPDAESCDDDWTFTRNLAETLRTCKFDTLDDDPLFTEFRATVEVTTVEDTGAEVFGQAVKQTRTTATEFGVRVPKTVSVTSGNVQAFPGFAGLEADGRTFAVVSTQAYDVAEEEFTLRVITAVAWPYVLELDGATPVERTSGSNTWTLGASFQGGDCDSGAAVDNVCVQQWDLTLDRISDCEADGEYDLNFDVRCSDAFGNGDHCQGLENPTASITIPVESDSVCARVVEVATVTPTIVTSTSQGGAQATDFVLQTTLFGRVSVAAEGGIATSSVVLTDLLIDSDCTSCAGGDGDTRNPFTDSSPLPSTYLWATTPDTTFADFQFQLNTNSVPFDTGAGQASLTLTATVAVTYVSASGQQVTELRRVQMQAGAAAETVTSRATAQIGVGTQSGAAPSSGASSSAAVSGTVAVAAFVAIVAVVVGAAVVVRKRRAASASASASASAKQMKHSSSTADVAAAAVQLDILPAAEGDLPEGTVIVDASTLGGVQEAYDTIGAH